MEMGRTVVFSCKPEPFSLLKLPARKQDQEKGRKQNFTCCYKIYEIPLPIEDISTESL